MVDGYVFALHSSKCPYRKNKSYKKCRCRKWIYEFGTRKRYSAKTRSWEQAEKLLASDATIKEGGMTVAKAVEAFLEDKRQQHIGDEYQKKLELLLDAFVEFCRVKPVQRLNEITLSMLEEFRGTWKGVPITRRKKQERLRSFFHYCVRHEWLRTNPAVNLSRIKVEQKPTDYFTKEEFAKLLDAVPLLGMDSRNPNQDIWRQKIRALVLLMRWSGLRIGDAVALARDRLKGDTLLLYTQKTGVPVYVPLPADVATSLRELPNTNPAYFFWSGNGLKKSAVADYQRSFARLCAHAKLGKRAHPHMLRDTFAVELLLSGVSLEVVSTLLGHSSIKITEKHYSPWVRARQEKLEASVRKSWA